MDHFRDTTSTAAFHQQQKRLKHFASLALIANPRVKTRTGRRVLNEVLQRPQVTCSETGQEKKINLKINLKSTLCALLKHLCQQSPVRKNSGHAHIRKASKQRGGKVWNLPVSNALRAAQETSPMRRNEEATVQETMVRLKGSQVERTQEEIVDAQTGGCSADRPPVRPSVRPSVRLP